MIRASHPLDPRMNIFPVLIQTSAIERCLTSDADKCNHCPQKEQCTKSKKGRTIHIHPYEDRIEQQREFQKTAEFKEDYAQRSNGERTISELTKHGGRQGRYEGKQKIKWQLTMAAINNNIKATLRFLHKKSKICPQGVVCPEMG